MTLLYRILFCSAYTTDEEKDLAIQNRYITREIPLSQLHVKNFYIFFRIRQLNWVSGKNLECRIHETSAEVRELVYTSITGTLNFGSRINLLNSPY